MGSLVLTGDTSGSGTIAVPAVAGTFTATIGSATGTHYPITLGTSVASTSGTAIDFTSIPSWVKRITVMFVGVSTSSTSPPQIQIGSGSVTTSGYVGSNSIVAIAGVASTLFTSGFGIGQSTSNWSATSTMNGSIVLTSVAGNSWSCFGVVSNSVTSPATYITSGSITLGGTLDRIRITTVNGTDTFDAGSINILYE
jgi:hypothetical protein